MSKLSRLSDRSEPATTLFIRRKIRLEVSPSGVKGNALSVMIYSEAYMNRNRHKHLETGLQMNLFAFDLVACALCPAG